MNASITRAHDPYITITEAYWPPYVELVIRAVRILMIVCMLF